MTPVEIVGLLTDAALGGLSLVKAFQEFRDSRDPGETPKQAAAEYVREMLKSAPKEQLADNAVEAWLAAHGR